MWKISSFYQSILEIQSILESCEQLFGQVLLYVNLPKHVKDQTISLICSGDMVDNAIWLTKDILVHISGTKMFPNMGFVQEHSQQYKFLLQIKFSKN